MTYPLFKEKKNDVHLVVQDYSGWRQYNSGKTMTWHYGADLTPKGSDKNFRAPEDGAFWIYNPGGSSRYNIRLPWGDSEYLNEEKSYNDTVFGFITVFVTNPDNPKAGRIYLFCHQGGKDNSNADSKSDIEVLFKDEYGQTETFPFASAANKPNEMRRVKAGDWIGEMGERYKFPLHLHLDVYEYFDEVPETKDYHWQRIDPYSIVKSEWVKDGWGIIEHDDLKAKIETSYGSDIANKYFRDLP